MSRLCPPDKPLRCRVCGRPIWRGLLRSGRALLMDASPSPAGTFLRLGAVRVRRILRPGQTRDLGDRYACHWDSSPGCDQRERMAA